MICRRRPLENIVGKGENAGSQHFYPFPTMFSTLLNQFLSFYENLFCHLQILSLWTIPKLCLLVKIETPDSLIKGIKKEKKMCPVKSLKLNFFTYGIFTNGISHLKDGKQC